MVGFSNRRPLRKLLLVNQRELELVMINMTNEWLKTMNHVVNIHVMYSLFHWRCLLQQTDNITTIYRVDHLE